MIKLLLFALPVGMLCNMRMIINVPATACVGDTIRFSVVAVGGDTPYTYYWQGGNDSLDASATSQNPMLVIPAASVYTVNCTVFDARGCNVTSMNNVLTVTDCK